jgi:hypothetical protein
MGDDHLELGGLRDDRRVGPDRAQHLPHADARVLLVGHRRHHDVPRQRPGSRFAAADESRREARLHVVGTAAIEPIAIDARRVRVRHAVDADRVQVRAQQQRASAAPPARADHDARAP